VPAAAAVARAREPKASAAATAQPLTAKSHRAPLPPAAHTLSTINCEVRNHRPAQSRPLRSRQEGDEARAHSSRALSLSLARALFVAARAPVPSPPPRHPTSTRPHRLTPLAPRARLAALAARRAREGGSTTALPLPVFFSLPPPAAPPGACAPRPSLALLIAIHFLPPPLQPARSLPLPSTKHPHAPNTPRALSAAAADDDPIRRQRDSPWLHLSSSLARPYSFVSPMVP
jgi:hypothetical protein